MYHYERVKDLHLLLHPYKFITFIGAGGKTSLSEYMAKNFAKEGLVSVITTTTKIYAKEPFILEDNLTEDLLNKRSFFRIGSELKDGKLHGISLQTLLKLGEFYDFVLIEGDGAKGRPLKYPSFFEPVIPEISDFVILVCGLDGLSKKVNEVVFRWELYCEKEGVRGEDRIDERSFLKLVCGAMLKSVGEKKYAIFLNKYDAQSQKKSIINIATNILNLSNAQFVLISSVNYGIFYVVRKL